MRQGSCSTDHSVQNRRPTLEPLPTILKGTQPAQLNPAARIIYCHFKPLQEVVTMHRGSCRVIHETREDDMRLKTLAPIVLFVLLTLTCDGRAQQSGKSVASSPAWNDNSLITVQQMRGDPARPGDVKIEFYGHDAFKITSPTGLRVRTDSWRNDSTGLYPNWFLNEFPPIRIDADQMLR
jgi:hypothetical protein